MAKKLILRKSKQAPAGLFKRIVAFLLDLAILNFVVVWPFRGIIARLAPVGSIAELTGALNSSPVLISQLNLIYLVIGLIFFVYFTISESRFSQSPGKMLVGLYVKSGRQDPSFWQVVIRNLFMIPFFPIIILWIIDPISLIITKGKQRFSDMVAKTNVVQSEKQSWI